jgi:hypothetical protein
MSNAAARKLEAVLGTAEQPEPDDEAADLPTGPNLPADQSDDDNPLNVGASWEPVDTAAVLAAIERGEVTRPVPTVLLRDDGTGLVYPGKVNGIAGPGGTAKSWIAQKAAADELVVERAVVYVDLEDDAAAVITRLRALGVAPADIAAGFTYVAPTEGYGNDARARLEAVVAQVRPSLVVIDSTGEALAMDGANPNADEEVARWFARLPRALARLGPAVLVLDHMPHTVEDGRLSPIGSQRKTAAINGAQYVTFMVRPFSRDTPGMVKLVCGKDRLGTYRRGQTVAEVAVTPTWEGETVGIALVAPSETEGGKFRPTHLMERVSRHLEVVGGALSRNAVRDQVPGNDKAVVAALAALVEEGFVVVTKQGQAHLHHSVKPYREDME